MPLDAVFERFAKKSPLPLMARLLMQRALSPEWLDELFEAHRQRQHPRELLFSTQVDLMALVALGLRPSLHAAAQERDELSVSIQALCDKVNHTEPHLVRALMQGSGERLTPVVEHLKLQQPPWAAAIECACWMAISWRRARRDSSRCAASEERRCPASRWWCTRQSGTWW